MMSRAAIARPYEEGPLGFRRYRAHEPDQNGNRHRHKSRYTCTVARRFWANSNVSMALENGQTGGTTIMIPAQAIAISPNEP